jgi:hypothetical protein
MKFFCIEIFDEVRHKHPVGLRSIVKIDDEIFTSLKEQLHEVACVGLKRYVRSEEIKIDEKGHNNILVNLVAQGSVRYKILEAIESTSNFFNNSNWKDHGGRCVASQLLADIGLHKTATLTLDEEFDIQEQIHCEDEKSMDALARDYGTHFSWKKNPYKGYIREDDPFSDLGHEEDLL